MPELDVLHILLIGAAVLGMLLTWRWTRGRTGRRNRARQRVASRGERSAERLLRKAGYRLVERQVTRRWTLWVDGKPVQVSCRADLIVRRRSKRYIAEVKTGERAVDPALPATRRQLMEYQHVFDVDGIILVDMAHGLIRTVSFVESST
ncbi:MAG: Holliday junction resolvase-like predicted endonuclease [Kiritimatiellia bacterium]|jgi:Holliday junction resolvase-like predicted endonuclease